MAQAQAQALIDSVIHDQINNCTSRWYPNIISFPTLAIGKKFVDNYFILVDA